VRHGAGPILQTAVATGLAWEICVRGLDHRRPIFAAIVAIVAMGFSAGRRGRAALLLVIGVATASSSATGSSVCSTVAASRSPSSCSWR
jgi:uncharacterized membrane protein YgaE (UPF0421/DUF939 family)